MKQLVCLECYTVLREGQSCEHFHLESAKVDVVKMLGWTKTKLTIKCACSREPNLTCLNNYAYFKCCGRTVAGSICRSFHINHDTTTLVSCSKCLTNINDMLVQQGGDIKVRTLCKECRGTGNIDINKFSTCEMCNGSGGILCKDDECIKGEHRFKFVVRNNQFTAEKSVCNDGFEKKCNTCKGCGQSATLIETKPCTCVDVKLKYL